MSYFSNVEAASSVDGLGCGPKCSCGPCKSGINGLDEWYEKEQEARTPPAATPVNHSQRAASQSQISEWNLVGFSPAHYRTPLSDGYLPNQRYGEPPPARRVCDNVPPIPGLGPVTRFAANKLRCANTVFGETNPVGVVRAAVVRALEMLDNTIGELVNARTRVCQGEAPAWPLLGDITLEWLRERLSVCVDDIRVWTADTRVNRSVAEVIRRLVRVRNLIASNHIRYVCGGRCNPADPASGCVAGDWAFICRPDPCPTGSIPSIVHLCRNFWVRATNADGTLVDPLVHAEFQAQTIIHEASHLYHCTRDERGRTIGVAECLAQFVAATNRSPIDCNFGNRCMRTTVCGGATAAGPDPCDPVVAAAQQKPGRLGFAGPGSFRTVRTAFRPQTAIRLKGRPAVRQQAARR